MIRLFRLGARMRWTITRNSLRRRGSALFVLALVSSAIGALGGFITIAGAAVAEADVRRAILLFVFTLGLIAWVFAPLLMGGTDETVDPAPLALLPLRGKDLAAVMAGAATTSPATLAVAVALLATPAVGAGGGVLGALVALLTAAALFVTGLGASRTLAAVMGLAHRTRRGRDISVVVAALSGVALWAISQSAAPAIQAGAAEADSTLLRVLEQTPPGWAARAVLHCREGDVLAALPWTAAVAAVGAALVWVWARLAGRLLVGGATRSGGRAEVAGAPLWPRAVDPASAAFAKEWHYQWRSPMRRTQAIIGVALSAGFSLLQVLPVRDPSPKLIYSGLMALLFSANNAFNVVGFDSPSLWLEFSAAGGIRRHQLVARLVTYGSGTVASLVAAGFTVAAAKGLWSELPLYLAFTPMAVACLLGVGAVISAAAPLAAVDGDNPFKRPAGNTGCTYALAVIGAMAGMAVLVAPFVVPALLWDGNWRFVLAAGGAVWGWLVWRHGVARAMRTLERHGPDLMAELNPRLAA